MKVNPGGFWHLADHHDAVSGEHSTYVRSAHSQGGNRNFRRCIAEKTRGHGGSALQVRLNLAQAAKACKGTPRGR